MKRLVAVAIVCVIMASPAMANLFDFHFGSLYSSFDGADTFNAWVNPNLTSGSVVRIQDPQGSAVFVAPDAFPFPGFDDPWGNFGGNFVVNMTISDITATSAVGNGTFAITDINGDVITGNLAGNWRPDDSANKFDGRLSDVVFIDNGVQDDSFEGHGGSIPMDYSQDQPWPGTIIELATTGTWFEDGAFRTDSGSVDASVVPVPGAVLLGLLGMGVAGLKLRKSV